MQLRHPTLYAASSKISGRTTKVIWRTSVINSVVLFDLDEVSDQNTDQIAAYTPDTDDLPYACVFWIMPDVDRPHDTQISTYFRFENGDRILFSVLQRLHIVLHILSADEECML